MYSRHPISPQYGAHQDVPALIIHHRKAVVLARAQGVEHGARSLQGSQAAHLPRHGLGGRHVVLFRHGGTLVLKERQLKLWDNSSRRRDPKTSQTRGTDGQERIAGWVVRCGDGRGYIYIYVYAPKSPLVGVHSGGQRKNGQGGCGADGSC